MKDTYGTVKEFNTHTHAYKQNWGNLNKISELCQCQYSGCNIFHHVTVEETEFPSDLSELFLLIACKSTVF